MKFILILFLFFAISHSVTFQPEENDHYSSFEPGLPQNDSQEEAFVVLRSKCNTCHATKKRTEVFTKENMSKFAPEIYEQVFVKKKMPKGRKVKLTENETLLLKRWLKTVLDDNELSKTKKSR